MTGAVDLVRRLRRLYAEDGAEGHIAAVQELVAAATTSTRLAEQIRAETARWHDFAETVLRGLLANTPLAALVPTRELATAAVAAYLGMEMLSHVNADRTTSEALFDAAERAAALAAAALQRTEANGAAGTATPLAGERTQPPRPGS